MMDFLQANTLSEFGGVARDLCIRDEDGYITGIKGTKDIMKSVDGLYVEETVCVKHLDDNIMV